MNKDERSKLDELWDASGLSAESPKKEPPKEAPKPESKAEEPKPEKPKKEKKEKPPKPEKPKKEKPKKEKAPKESPAEMKKDIKFLVLYTTVFVIVISGLIGGSYMITSRIHKQMAENNAEINMNQSTLTNIQNENTRLKDENSRLKEQNEALTTSQKEAEETVAAVGDIVEQDAHLIAAQSAYIQGNEELAAQLVSVIDREKLSQPNKAAYDLLKEELE